MGGIETGIGAAPLKPRNLNVLDIRNAARILKEIKLPQDEAARLAADVFKAAQEVRKGGGGVETFISALVPALYMALDILDSSAFWAFAADIFRVTPEELTNCPVNAFAAAVKDLLKNGELTDFFSLFARGGKEPRANAT